MKYKNLCVMVPDVCLLMIVAFFLITSLLVGEVKTANSVVVVGFGGGALDGILVWDKV